MEAITGKNELALVNICSNRMSVSSVKLMMQPFLINRTKWCIEYTLRL